MQPSVKLSSLASAAPEPVVTASPAQPLNLDAKGFTLKEDSGLESEQVTNEPHGVSSNPNARTLESRQEVSTPYAEKLERLQKRDLVVR